MFTSKEASAMKDIELTAVYEKADEGGYTAYIAEMDGVNTQGETIKEAQENLLDAFHLIMECRKEDLELKRKNGKLVVAPFMSLSSTTSEETTTT